MVLLHKYKKKMKLRAYHNVGLLKIGVTMAISELASMVTMDQLTVNIHLFTEPHETSDFFLYKRLWMRVRDPTPYLSVIIPFKIFGSLKRLILPSNDCN